MINAINGYVVSRRIYDTLVPSSLSILTPNIKQLFSVRVLMNNSLVKTSLYIMETTMNNNEVIFTGKIEACLDDQLNVNTLSKIVNQFLIFLAPDICRKVNLSFILITSP